MLNKIAFYERYGVEECYIYYPDGGDWEGWHRKDDRLVPIEQMDGWTSPQLGIPCGKGYETNLGLQLPNGRRMLSFMEIAQMAERAQRKAEAERQRVERIAKRLAHWELTLKNSEKLPLHPCPSWGIIFCGISTRQRRVLKLCARR